MAGEVIDASSTEAGTAVALPDNFDYTTGLEDFRQTDMAMPRLNIEHKEAIFTDSLSGEKYPELKGVIVLGMIRQRILWPAEQGSEKKPLCRSNNFFTGQPNEDLFPWRKSGFTPGTQYDVVDDKGKPVPSPEGSVPCLSCPLKEFGSHPSRSNTTWCTEQMVFPVMLPVGGEVQWAPALLTLQRSGLRAAKNFLSSFVQKQRPCFSAFVNIYLDLNTQGSVDYSVPRFEIVGDVEKSEWPGFASDLVAIRNTITQPRRPRDESTEEKVAAPTAAATPSAPPVAASPAPAPTVEAAPPVATAPSEQAAGDEEDIPF